MKYLEIIKRHLKQNEKMLKLFQQKKNEGLKADKAIWTAQGRVNATKLILEELDK